MHLFYQNLFLTGYSAFPTKSDVRAPYTLCRISPTLCSKSLDDCAEKHMTFGNQIRSS